MSQRTRIRRKAAHGRARRDAGTGWLCFYGEVGYGKTWSVSRDGSLGMRGSLVVIDSLMEAQKRCIDNLAGVS